VLLMGERRRIGSSKFEISLCNGLSLQGQLLRSFIEETCIETRNHKVVISLTVLNLMVTNSPKEEEVVG
jgi:hypothetical protein